MSDSGLMVLIVPMLVVLLFNVIATCIIGNRVQRLDAATAEAIRELAKMKR